MPKYQDEERTGKTEGSTARVNKRMPQAAAHHYQRIHDGRGCSGELPAHWGLICKLYFPWPSQTPHLLPSRQLSAFPLPVFITSCPPKPIPIAHRISLLLALRPLRHRHPQPDSPDSSSC
ncbi:hypothetical protein M407DRAFT_246171 [Tulasnella calospora MUT 4182]|uniref:Uncharacterized protein n=1 Tax=Tulasnella calospora MUT 4182 TaxID=1051891 RepID=A0A0C3PWK4_9AGAM|nr:hypothetical protein M407DRAFT_246171 [Tulasnella calospora MUT 4182]